MLRSSVVALATAAVLFGQLLNVVHLALVQHQSCLEHGDLVHASTRVQPDATRHETALLVVEIVDGHSHDHCLGVESRRKAVLTSPAGELTARPPQPSAVLLDAASVPTHSRRWILAPKTSPPRGA